MIPQDQGSGGMAAGLKGSQSAGPSVARGRALSLEGLAVTHGPPPVVAQLPRVGIVILNCNGRHHLAGCFDSIQAMTYPMDRVDVWLVDNASDDGSVEEMRTRYGWVHLEQNPRNVGFSAGCNQGAALAARAEVLVFLNNDIRVEPNFLTELVAPIVRREATCTAGKMLAWDGQRIDSAGGGMNFHGIGLQLGYQEAPQPVFDLPRRTLFACGGAMAIDAKVFAAVGGFDEEYFAYYEDVDLGWRLWLAGQHVHYTPKAVCYHHHSSTSKRFPPETLRLLQVRNPVYSCFKNYDDANLARCLPAILALAQRRAHLVSGLVDTSAFRIENARPGEPSLPAGAQPGSWRSRLAAKLMGEERLSKLRSESPADLSLSRLGLADWIGAQDLLGRMDHWMARRAKVQSMRRRADQDILPLFLKPLWCVEGDASYRDLQRHMVRILGIDAMFENLTIEGHDPR